VLTIQVAVEHLDLFWPEAAPVIETLRVLDH